MYRIRSSGEVKTQGEIRKMYYNISFPKIWDSEVCNSIGIDPVLETPQPVTTRYQTATKDKVVQDNKGNWVWAWSIGPVFTAYTDENNVTHSVEEQENKYRESLDNTKKESVRTERNLLLSETDWRFRSDMNPSQAWIDYCQALRDLPNQVGFPWDVQWPIKPE